MLTLEEMCKNVRIFAKYVRTQDNGPSDALSRLDFDRFHRLTAHKSMCESPRKIPEQIWPIQKI